MSKSKKLHISALLLIALIALVSCATTGSYFAGTVGGVYVTSDMYSPEFATGMYTNESIELKPALWMYNKNTNKPSSVDGCKVLFYSDLDNKGFYNEYIPEEYRASSLKDAGFLLVAVSGHDIFYDKYTITGTSTPVDVYYGTGTLRLYSIKTGELLETSSPVKGPTPPSNFSCPVGVSTTWWEYPEPSAFKSVISSMCKKIATGRIKSSVVDTEAVAAATGKEVNPVQEKKTVVNITGTWTAEYEDMKFVYIFTDKGHCIRETYVDGILDYLSVEPYKFVDATLVIDGVEVGYQTVGKKICFDDMSDLEFTKTQSNAAEKNRILGVWSGQTYWDEYQVAFASNGLFICQGSVNYMGSWEPDSYDVLIAGDDYEYFIVNNTMYILDEGVFDTYDWIRLENVSTEGKDNTSFDILTSQEWDYRARGGESGHLYNFSSNKSYTDTPYNGLTLSSTKKGTFTFANHVINLSSGSKLSFAIIDNTAIGFDL